MKKILTVSLCASLLSLSLFGCSSSNTADTSTDATAETATLSTSDTAADDSSSTVTGQVTAIDGTTVTLLLGELTESGMTQDGAPSGEAPSGEAPSGEAPTGEAPSGETASGETASGETASGEAPSGETASGEAPSGEAPSGEAPSGETASGEAPSGEAPSGEAPTGEAPSDNAGEGGSKTTFTAGEESITFTINDDTAIYIESMGENTEGTIDDISVDVVLEVTVDESNNATVMIIKNIMNDNRSGEAPDVSSDSTEENAANSTTTSEE